MKWKYHIPHKWESPEARHVWEDVWLMPADPDYSGKSLWITVDALGDVNNPEHGSERAAFQAKALAKLGDNDTWVRYPGDQSDPGTDMIVRVVDFSREELIEWVRFWMMEVGLEVDELVEAPFDDFRGTNTHAIQLAAVRDEYTAQQQEQGENGDG